MTTTTDGTPIIKVVPFDPDRFDPYGEVIDATTTPPLSNNLYQGANRTHGPVRIDSDHPVELLVLRGSIRPFRVRYLERHVEITQTFIPLGGDPYIFVCAKPDATLQGGFPRLQEIQAFMVDGATGVNIHRGTWHEPAFPLVDGSMCVLSSHDNLTRGLRSTPDENGEINRLDVDKRNANHRVGAEIVLELP